MKIHNLKIVHSMVPLFVIISLVSCSKDTDLLADYLISDLQEARFIENLAINDNFVVASQKSIVLDVLANDTFTDLEKVKIVETSQPANGTVIINDNNTLTYFPDAADAPKPDSENEVEGAQPEPKNNEVEDEANPPTPIETVEETSQEPVTKAPKEEETEPTQQKEEQKKTGTEDFTYTVGTKDKQNNETTQEATVTVTMDSGSGESKENSGNLSNDESNSYNYPPNAVFASSFGFDAEDSTEAFVDALNSGSSFVVIDSMPSEWIIRPTRMYDLQDMTIVFEPGVTLRSKTGYVEQNRMFELFRAKNITIEGTGATFKMNKSEYTSGEQRHAFGITLSENITVRGLTFRDSGGDGILIYGGGGSNYSKNITIENVKCINNRRNGMTIVSAENVWVTNSEFSRSSGTNPGSGVDLEPDNPAERLVNINFNNCKFFDNTVSGFQLGLYYVDATTSPLSIKITDCEFSNNVTNPPPGLSTAEIRVGANEGYSLIEGEILFERVMFNGSPGRLLFSRQAGDGFKVVLKDCEARGMITATSQSPIGLEGRNTRNSLGSVVFDNLYIEYDKDVPFMQIRAPSMANDGQEFVLKNIKGTITIKEPGDNPLEYAGSYRHQTDRNINVSINYKHI